MTNTNKTTDEFKAKFETVRMQAFNIFFNNAPVSSGRLRGMITLTDTPTGFIITSNADYTEFTEESGVNAGWFKKSMNEAFNYIVKEMSV